MSEQQLASTPHTGGANTPNESSIIKQSHDGAYQDRVKQYGATQGAEDEQLSQSNTIGGSSALFSKTDMFPKIGLFPTTANVIKSMLCLGVLETPFGLQSCGIIPGLLIIMLFGTLNMYSVHIQQRIKMHYGQRVKTYTDMGKVSFGFFGYIFVALIIIMNQILTCIGYCLFFYQQMVVIFQNLFDDYETNFKYYFYIASIFVLLPLSLLESMQAMSYISVVAMMLITAGLLYVIVTDCVEIANPTFDKTYIWWNPAGIPYFFGVANFMFEGIALVIEIYQQMEDAPYLYNRALSDGLLFTSTFMLLIGSLSYCAYAQFTNGTILLNLKPGIVTYIIQLGYCTAILCSYCLQVIPTFKIFRILPFYEKIPEYQRFPYIKSGITRVIVVLFVATLAYTIPNLTQLLNFQGAFCGIWMTLLFPVIFYFKSYKERISKSERILCIGMFIFGVVGGSIASGYALYELVK